MVFDTIDYGEIEILEYSGWDNVLVKFKETGYITKTRSWLIKTGIVRDNLKPSVQGVGFLGQGDYTVYRENKISHEYKLWQSILNRCYSPNWPCYENCTVQVDWHNFQNFAKWYSEYPYVKVGWQLDKDILGKNNKDKIYSKETCSFVPQEVNSCIAQKPKGELPYGVSFRNGRYRVSVSEDSKRRSLGTYDTVEEASFIYNIEKQKVITKLAEKHKEGLDPRTYNALLSWIT